MASRSDVDNYDVFINFRGADTRHGFVKILYDELVAEGIRVFLDDEELNYGKRLDEELPQAINNSKIYITVISETYASSKWCLREIVEIVRNKQEFRDKKEILPVFYKIRTNDVKLKTNLFKDQLKILINKNVNVETVEKWGVTLKGITDLKAWKVPSHGGFKEDVECCREIVKRTSIILRVKHKPLPKELIGMEDPVEEVVQLLDIKNHGLQVIGIHGMGGSGKTTLAKAIYNQLCDTIFDCCCFLPDVRESLDKDKGSKACLELQKKLLKEVSYRGNVDGIRDVDDGIRKIQLTMEGKKVLMIFDDISKSDQVVSLIGQNYSLLGKGCRIIITTRDDRVLRSRELKDFTKIYKMKAMRNEHALELFSWHAFGEPTPPDGYSLVSNDAVSLTGRLPLSLEVTGSLFFVGGRKNWKHTVEKLKKMPNEDVYERLKISYEDLEEGTKEIFLDIACLFVDKERSHEFYMWDACDFFPELAVEELISMCFVKMDDNGTYMMHDHIKDLGREIVRQEGPKDTEQHSRIWKRQDAINILTASRKKENNKIEGILLEDRRDNDKLLTLKGENCVNLDRLRFLHLGWSKVPGSPYRRPSVEVHVEGSFEHVLPNLRWLSLQCMKMMRFNATNFSLKKLVILNFSESDITERWVGWKQFKDLPSLEVLNLSECHELKKTPDLSQCTSLKELLLSYCSKLEQIDGSITSLRKLRRLHLTYCSRELKQLPDSIGQLVELEVLLLCHCEGLVSLSNSVTRLRKLRHLDLSWCEKLKNLPDSIGELVELEVLLLCHCYSLVSLPNSLTRLPKLQNLDVSSCKSLESFPDSNVQMVQLIEVDLSYLPKLKKKKLPEFISKQKRLEVLRANSMGMEGVPTEIEELNFLREIKFDFADICGLPSLVKLTLLETLSLWGCENLQQLPEPLPTSLIQLRVSSKSLWSIPAYSYLIHLTHLELQLGEWKSDERQELNVNWIWRLSKLKKLRLIMLPSYTTTIKSEESSSVSRLEDLTLHCSVLGTCVIPSFQSALRKLELKLYKGTVSLSLPRLNRLTHFTLAYSDDLTQIVGLEELESLVSLNVTSCDSLERLDGISKLRQLRTLEIRYCEKLRVISVAPCLKEVMIVKCESLESLVGSSEESKGCADDLHRVENLYIYHCPLLENKLHVDFVENVLLKGKFLEEQKRRRR